MNPTMEKIPEKTSKEWATLAIEARLKKKDYKSLAELVDFVDRYKLKKSLRLKAWFQTGLYWQREGAQSDAIIALNSARVLSPLDAKILTPFFESFNRFLSDFRDVISQEDLELLADPVESLLEFYESKGILDSPALAMGKHVSRRINYIKRDAKSAVETKASYQVERIVKALRENVTKQQVAEEYARIMAPVFLELMAKDKEVKGPQPSTAGAGGRKDGGDSSELEHPKKNKRVTPKKSLTRKKKKK